MSGIQNYAGIRIIGNIIGGSTTGPVGIFSVSGGLFRLDTPYSWGITPNNNPSSPSYVGASIDTNNVYQPANEFRVRNRIIRIYRRLA